MFPIGFDHFPCHVLSNFNRFSHGSPLCHQTGKIIRCSEVMSVFDSPDPKAQPIFLCHLYAPFPRLPDRHTHTDTAKGGIANSIMGRWPLPPGLDPDYGAKGLIR